MNDKTKPEAQAAGVGPPWRTIDDLPESDDLFWFLRWDSVGGYTEDGPRRPQAGGYDADEWTWFAVCESPPISALTTPASHDAQQPSAAVGVDGLRQGNWHHPDGGRIVGWVIEREDADRMGPDCMCLPKEVAEALANLRDGYRTDVDDMTMLRAASAYSRPGQPHAEALRAAVAAALAQQPAVVGDGSSLLRDRLEEVSKQYGPLSPVGAGIDRAIRELDALTPAATPGDAPVPWEWRWVDENDRAMTAWKRGDPPPMLDVSDSKGTMRVEVRIAQKEGNGNG